MQLSPKLKVFILEVVCGLLVLLVFIVELLFLLIDEAGLKPGPAFQIESGRVFESERLLLAKLGLIPSACGNRSFTAEK